MATTNFKGQPVKLIGEFIQVGKVAPDFELVKSDLSSFALKDLKGKNIVLNIQSRPGQSGSPIVIPEKRILAGILIGSYAPKTNGGIIIGGIDPQTLHQTTHAVSVEYVKEML